MESESKTFPSKTFLTSSLPIWQSPYLSAEMTTSICHFLSALADPSLWKGTEGKITHFLQDCTLSYVSSVWIHWFPESDTTMNACMHAKSLQSCPTLCDPWTVARQAPLSVGFSRQGHWGGLPALLQAIFPTQGLNPRLLQLLQCRWIFSTESPGKPCATIHLFMFPSLRIEVALLTIRL